MASCNKLSELELDLEDFENLLSLAKRDSAKQMLTEKVEKIRANISSIKKRAEQESSSRTSPGNKCYDAKIENYAWDQSDKYVKIYTTLNDVQSLPSDQVKCEFTSSSFSLQVNALGNKNYTLVVKNLLAPIVVENCFWKVKTDMVVVFLMKTKTGEKWSHVTNLEKKVTESKAPKYDANKDEDPSAGLMSLMKQMYQDGDDEMKRTIAKAWTESQGKKNTVDL